MDYPKTTEEWWKSVNDNWPNLLSILHRFIGMTDNEDIDGKLTEETKSVGINGQMSKTKIEE